MRNVLSNSKAINWRPMRDQHKCVSFHVHVHVHVALTTMEQVHVHAHDKEVNLNKVYEGVWRMPTLSATQSNWYNQQHEQSKQQLHVLSYSTNIQRIFLILQSTLLNTCTCTLVQITTKTCHKVNRIHTIFLYVASCC